MAEELVDPRAIRQRRDRCREDRASYECETLPDRASGEVVRVRLVIEGERFFVARATGRRGDGYGTLFGQRGAVCWEASPSEVDAVVNLLSDPKLREECRALAAPDPSSFEIGGWRMQLRDQHMYCGDRLILTDQCPLRSEVAHERAFRACDALLKLGNR